MLHEPLSLLEHQRLSHSALVGTLEGRRKIDMDRHAFGGRAIEDFLTHRKGVLKPLADIVLIHLFGGRERNRMRGNAGAHRQFVALHIGHQRAVGQRRLR